MEASTIQKDLVSIITEALDSSLSSTEYYELLQKYAVEEKTTGPAQSEDLIYYTKLNAQRSKRISKTVQLNEQLSAQLNSVSEKQTWILITESWCGDAANSVPVLSKLAEGNTSIDLRIVLRDSNPNLMDEFLTSGGKSIPKLIVVNEALEVLYTWGPRPQEAQKLYDEWRFSEDKVPYKEFQVDLQKWYNADKGQSLQEEILELNS